jgi:4-cresol dehydrogenase (hydroxylating)
LLKGTPSNEPLKHIHWKIGDTENLGLLWLGPTIPASEKDVRNLINTAKPIYKKYGYEFPITMSFVEPAQLVGILSITFNKNNPEDLARARKAYDEITESFERNGINLYRSGLLSMPHINYQENKNLILKSIKQTLDANNTISPGRYNI